MQSSVPASLQTSTEISEVIKTYGNSDNFISTFSPAHTGQYMSHPDRCLCGSAPTILRTKMAYKENTIVSLLKMFIEQCLRAEGVAPEKLSTPAEIDQAARAMVAKYLDVKVSELFLFFGGYHDNYEKHHGKVANIRQAFRQYYAERGLQIAKYESRLREEAEQQVNRKTITYEEYQRAKLDNLANNKE